MVSKGWLCYWEQRIGGKSSAELSTILSLLILAAVLCYIWLERKRKDNPQLPPGPRGLPLLGSLPFLNRQLHSCFAKLSKQYGPVFKVRLGSKLCIVFSSPSVAKQVLKDHDTTFADRFQSVLGKAVSYGGMDLAMASHGNHWQMLRKICVKELINHERIETFYSLCRKEARHMVKQIYSKSGSPITIIEEVLLTTVKITTSMMWGDTLENDEMSRVSAEIIPVAQEIMRLLGEFNVSDFFPTLSPFDLQGKERKMKKIVASLDKTFHLIIDRRRNQMESIGETESSEEREKDFLTILLTLIEQGDHKTPLSITHLKALFLDFVLGGTQSTISTIEWAISEMMNHPALLKKVVQELDHVVGLNNMVEESHLPKLQYLQAVVKEVLRLHPLSPLLLPRRPKESCIIGGYLIPKGAIAFVNVWSIQRDPKYWADPLEFRPERFLNSTSKWNFNGNDFRYFPFGSGRRMCVGMPIAEKQISYLIASLLHSFKWELPEKATLDFAEAYGLGLMKKIPLVAIPTPRLFDPALYT